MNFCLRDAGAKLISDVDIFVSHILRSLAFSLVFRLLDFSAWPVVLLIVPRIVANMVRYGESTIMLLRVSVGHIVGRNPFACAKLARTLREIP